MTFVGSLNSEHPSLTGGHGCFAAATTIPVHGISGASHVATHHRPAMAVRTVAPTGAAEAKSLLTLITL